MTVDHQAIRTLTQQAKNIHSIFDAAGNRIAEYDYDSSTGTSTLLAEYVWMNGALIGTVDGATGNEYNVRTDHIGRPVFATGSGSGAAWEATYKPFGNMDVATGSPVALRFPGQWYSSVSALHQHWMRDRSATTGRLCIGQPIPA